MSDAHKNISHFQNRNISKNRDVGVERFHLLGILKVIYREFWGPIHAIAVQIMVNNNVQMELCDSCVHRSGSLVTVVAIDDSHLDRVTKSCKFCFKASRRHIEKIYPSESPQASPEPSSPFF
ncbi:hypothetical protein Nepgr_017016 [Nepenthes gracilis]|uniref:Uncharacterized protein n=1 Tax=Nepenthes gracilis TaxID=150966 RepID=A0AAD3SQU1_NEPGR|nr:hypothetical protein Nepgr_017016 [Nepenthes gracilis]